MEDLDSPDNFRLRIIDFRDFCTMDGDRGDDEKGGENLESKGGFPF